ncbi:hypothetical protein lerEdw1_008388 [Lerista edwardsae]|nr:hypothetical protein lerEdw1_008388 [Lerista edwardsae]
MASKAGEPRVPMTLQKSRLKAEEKILDLDFELVNVQFNETGRYALRLTVENPLLEGSGAGVQLRLNEGDPVYTNTATTDIIEQSNLNEVYAFEKRRFLFTLPKGFCKNDKNHDARLRIEALRFRGSLLKTSLKAGEAFFAIYPRTNQPRMNLFASRDEDLYGYSDIMALLRVGDDELAMHCGKLAYTVSFHEHRPMVPKRETPITPCCLSPLPATKEEETYPAGASSSTPFQSLGIPRPVYPGSTSESSPRFLPLVESHSPVLRNFKQVLSEPSEPQYGTSSEVMRDLPDEDLSSSPPASSSSPPIPRRLPSDASLHLPSPGYSPELDFAETLLELQVSNRLVQSMK